MALTDTFTGAQAGDKHTDGHGVFLLVKVAGKYWRMSYRFDGKQKTLALDVYELAAYHWRGRGAKPPANCWQRA